MRVLILALAIAAIVGTPVIFVAFYEIRRVCGNRLFGSRQHFCNADEFWTWTSLLPHWSYGVFPVVVIAGIWIARWALRKIAS